MRGRAVELGADSPTLKGLCCSSFITMETRALTAMTLFIELRIPTRAYDVVTLGGEWTIKCSFYWWRVCYWFIDLFDSSGLFWNISLRIGSLVYCCLSECYLRCILYYLFETTYWNNLVNAWIECANLLTLLDAIKALIGNVLSD